MNYIILSKQKELGESLVESLTVKFPSHAFVLACDNKSLKEELAKENNISKVFIPHWSSIIPASIYNNVECVVFHMTDLPFGRGGSPLQNLISRGISETKVTALQVNAEIDAGDVYLKKELNLTGSAQIIFERVFKIIEEMIGEIIQTNPKPQPQKGEPTYFKRRTPDMSKIEAEDSIELVYDKIRMLDAPDYPLAFIENKHFRFEFYNANHESEKELNANVRIIKK
ncbi:methionyl-tRNA formyltransferase [Salibacteraceae bacterium]|jgi:methionyl-tRNA formyltransferase|nr:methionyl-tRNA formyltransferase [Crocinitomicaceae bacterium]MCH9823610.1 methionyl-tRNA formyltransferase [Bacteroidota bacterium]MDB0058435.1 methionyl-tRNA formyltransferase [Salibacteraceae bacterium]|tara:strand:+ start:24880 stop:25560 length:681 start_codon:yes stop_codon:yes gene_type:complete